MSSNYEATGQPDSTTNLATGSSVITTTLSADLSSTETDKVLIADGGLAEPRGVLAIDDEIIFYHQYNRSETGCMIDLLRGQRGTSAAAHSSGANVSIYGAPRFDNPALSTSMIALQTRLTTEATPAQIAANQNNYNPGSNTYLVRLSSDAARDITGLTFTPTQTGGESHILVNVGAFTITLKHQDANSTAGNRFLATSGADVALGVDAMVLVVYDTTTDRWRIFKSG